MKVCGERNQSELLAGMGKFLSRITRTGEDGVIEVSLTPSVYAGR